MCLVETAALIMSFKKGFIVDVQYIPSPSWRKT